MTKPATSEFPLSGNNSDRKDVQYLNAKYGNNYSVYGVPISVIGGVLEYKIEHQGRIAGRSFFCPANKETVAYSILDTLRNATKATDDYDLFKKTIAKVLRMFSRGVSEGLYNEFDDSYLDYKSDREIIEKIRYSREAYESSILQEMSEEGIKISRWKNESSLFLLVAKEFHDAIYQHHSKWLGTQSLDIFIPSLIVGIEYQGQQHYGPVEFFGGEKGFEQTKIRDKKKAQLCRANNVRLILWGYDEPISKARLKAKLGI